VGRPSAGTTNHIKRSVKARYTAVKDAHYNYEDTHPGVLLEIFPIKNFLNNGNDE
jgi:hypothetical protein